MSKTFARSSLCALGMTILTAQAAEPPKEIGKGEGRLDIIAWPGYIERGQTDKAYDWVTRFEQETGCKVNVKTAATSDEMVSLMAKGGYDLVTASGDASLRLIMGKRVQAINPERKRLASVWLERRITQENLTLLAREGATTWSSLQPGGDSWSLLRARFDPWFVAQAEAEGVQCLTGVTVTSLVKKSGRICGVIADDETLSARFVVLAEGANSELAQRHALVEPPATTAMALGIKEVLALDKSILEERFRLEEHEGAAMLFCGGICGSLPGGAFLYTNQTTLSLGIVCPLSTLTRGDTAANELLPQLKRHPALHPLLRESETLEYGAHLIPEGGLHGLPPRYAGEGWLLVGDALGTCVNTGFTVRGMDMALLGAQAAANTLIAACRTSGPQNLSHAYEQEIKHSRLWEVLQRYQSVPAACGG
jgi:electron transfer flavoprotein-quinone oxidoreductase